MLGEVSARSDPDDKHAQKMNVWMEIPTHDLPITHMFYNLGVRHTVHMC